METRESIILQQLLEVNNKILAELKSLNKLMKDSSPDGNSVQVTVVS